jgi:hypothetical protein
MSTEPATATEPTRAVPVTRPLAPIAADSSGTVTAKRTGAKDRAA